MSRMWPESLSKLGEARAADKSGDFDVAIPLYEAIINDGIPAILAFDRLIAIYRAHKMWDDLVRVIRIAIESYSKENEKKLKYSLVAKNKLKYKKEIRAAHDANIEFWGYCIFHKREMCLYNPKPVNKMLLLLDKYTAYEK